MKRFSLIAAISLLIALNTAAADLSIPRDTSFTRYSSWMKIKKKYPYARLVADTLPTGVSMTRDVVYTTIKDTPWGIRDLHVDIFRPDSAKSPLPAVLFVHGGGWNSGDKSLQHGLASAVAAHGYVTMAVEYRLTPEAKYPAGLHDIKTAIRWARHHADSLGIDPDRIAISGCSAGGQLAALAGMTNGSARHEGDGRWQDSSSDVQAVINIDGITTFVSDYNIVDVYERQAKHGGQLPVNAMWLGGMPDQARDHWDEASAILWVTDKSAPICFINSDLPRYRDGRDEIEPLLRSHGIYTEHHHVYSPIHPFWFFHPWFTPTVSHAVSFLNRELGGE
ncbi:MAG: alpha/beta hydrolase [Lachnoclostridium sp.]|nr:alpha/beta hydrolase [Lachnoclostridium sp.]